MGDFCTYVIVASEVAEFKYIESRKYAVFSFVCKYFVNSLKITKTCLYNKENYKLKGCFFNFAFLA